MKTSPWFVASFNQTLIIHSTKYIVIITSTYQVELQSHRLNGEILSVSYFFDFVRPCFIYYLLLSGCLYKSVEVKKKQLANTCIAYEPMYCI